MCQSLQYNHLDEEVEHIEASRLKAAGFTAAELKTMFAATEHYAKNNGDPFLVVPFMRRCVLMRHRGLSRDRC